MLTTSSYSPLVADVCDRQQGDTIIKQRARLVDMRTPETHEELCVIMELEVTAWSSEAGAYGVQLTALGTYPVFLRADNTCAVLADGTPVYQLITAGSVAVAGYEATAATVRDDRTGEVLTLPAGQDFAAFLADAPEQLTRQGDWFAALLQQPSPVSLRDLQHRFIVLADQPPYSKFALPLA